MTDPTPLAVARISCQHCHRIFRSYMGELASQGGPFDTAKAQYENHTCNPLRITGGLL